MAQLKQSNNLLQQQTQSNAGPQQQANMTMRLQQQARMRLQLQQQANARLQQQNNAAYNQPGQAFGNSTGTYGSFPQYPIPEGQSAPYSMGNPGPGMLAPCNSASQFHSVPIWNWFYVQAGRYGNQSNVFGSYGGVPQYGRQSQAQLAAVAVAGANDTAARPAAPQPIQGSKRPQDFSPEHKKSTLTAGGDGATDGRKLRKLAHHHRNGRAPAVAPAQGQGDGKGKAAVIDLTQEDDEDEHDI